MGRPRGAEPPWHLHRRQRLHPRDDLWLRFPHLRSEPSNGSLVQQDIPHVWGLARSIHAPMQMTSMSRNRICVITDDLSLRIVHARPAVGEDVARQPCSSAQHLSQHVWEAIHESRESGAIEDPVRGQDLDVRDATRQHREPVEAL